MPQKQREHVIIQERKLKHHFLHVLCLWVFLSLVPQVGGYFMSDSKAFLQGCTDHWTLLKSLAMPLQSQMTVCVDVYIVTSGDWTAFSYKSSPSPYYDLALQGDDSAVYAWLLGVRHSFPAQLQLGQWSQLCLQLDAIHGSFTLEINGILSPQQRTVITQSASSTGTLLLGCQPQGASSGSTLATVELYLFRIWADVLEHGACEEGTVVDWDSSMWGITRPQARVQDATLQCGMIKNVRLVRVKRGINTSQSTIVNSGTNVMSSSLTNAGSPQQQVKSTTTTSTTSATVTTTTSTTVTTVTTTPRSSNPVTPASAPLTSTTATTTTTSTSTTSTTTVRPTIKAPTSSTATASTITTSPPSTANTSTSTPITITTTVTAGLTATATTSSISTSTTTPTTITSAPTTKSTTTTTSPTVVATTTATGTINTAKTTSLLTTTSATIASTTTAIPPITATSTGTTTSTPTIIATITTAIPPTTATSTDTTTATTTTTVQPDTARTTTATSTSATTATTTTAATIFATPAANAVTNENSITTSAPKSSTAPITYLMTTTMSTTANSVYSSTRNSQPSRSTSFPSSVTHTSALTALFLIATSTGGSESSINITAHPNAAASTGPNPSYPSFTTLVPTTYTVNQTTLLLATTFSTLSTDSTIMVQCNLSQLCDNNTLYYWMFISVEVATGSNTNTQDVQAWLSDLFRPACDFGEVMQSSTTTLATYSNEVSDGATVGTASSPALCQDNSTVQLQNISVDCEDKTNFTKTNCTVQLQLSQPTDTCSIRQLLQQKSRDSSLHAELLGEVGRVGRNMCLDEHMLPPGDGFVYCNSPMPSSQVCQAENPINVTCSYKNRSIVLNDISEAQAQPCDNIPKYNCNCSRFCSDSGAFYSFSLSINSLNVTFDDVKNTVTQLDYPCNSTILSPLCNVSSYYEGVHIECRGDGTRLYSCIVALQVSQPLDLCTVSEAITSLLQSSTIITYNGILTRLALCGLPSDSSSSLLNSNFTWVSANINAEQICSLNQSLTTQFSCGNGQVLSVLLNERCAVPSHRSYTTPSTTQASSVFSTQNAYPEISALFSTAARPSTPNNSTDVEPGTTVSFPNTAAPLSSTVTPINTTVPPAGVTFNATAPSSKSVVIPINNTVMQTTATVSSQNVGLVLFNKTTSPAAQHNSTSLQQMSSQFNITQVVVTQAQANTTTYSSNSELGTPFHTTALQNASHLNSPLSQLSTTPATGRTQLSTVLSDNTAQIDMTQFKNDSVDSLSQNASHSDETVRDLSATLSNTTALPVNTTQYKTKIPLNATNEPSLNTRIDTTASFQYITESNTLIPVTNVTASLNIGHPNTASSSVYTTEQQITTASLNTAYSNNTGSPFYTTASFPSTLESNFSVHVTNASAAVNTVPPSANTTSSPLYTTAPSWNPTERNTTLLITNTTAYKIAAASVNTTQNTTSFPLSSFINMTDVNNSAYVKDTTAMVNITHPETTSPLQNTLQPNTTVNSATAKIDHSIHPILNTTQANMTTSEYNTTQINISAITLTPNVRNVILNFTDANATVRPLNITQFNVTLLPLNSTAANTTVSQNVTQYNETDNFNTSPTPTVTRINTTISISDILEQNLTTASDVKVTQTDITSMLQNITIEKSFTYNVTLDVTAALNATYTNDYNYESSPVLNMTSGPSFSLNISTNITTSTVYNTTFRSNRISEYQLSTTNPSTNTTGDVLAAPGATMPASTESTTPNTIAPGIAQILGITGPPSTASVVVPQLVVQTTTVTTSTTQTETTTSQSPQALAEQIAQMDMSSINSSQVQELVSQMENILSAPNISLNLATTVLSIINSLLNSTTDAVASASNQLIKAVDTLALKLYIPDKSESITFESLALMVTKIDGTDFMGASFTVTDPISLAVNSRRRRSVSSSNLGSIKIPASLTENLSPEEQQEASRVQFTFFKKSTLFQDKNNNLMLNSYILGSSVANLSIKGLTENVEVTLRNEEPVTRNVTCVFWDFTANGGSGGWNKSGCMVMNTSTENETVCSCNHLTSFAVLMDLSGVGITDRLQATILTFITYIGCGISAIFLSVTLLSYLAFEKIRKDIPSKILINLCFALLFLNLVFLLDSWLALYTKAVGLCISTAFFLHYFLLASFTWMGLEALHLYLAIVKVFNSCMSQYMLKFTLAGWGIPLLVVIIVIAVDKNNYGLIPYAQFVDGASDDFCWLKNTIAFYVAVVAYFCVIFVSNLIMFVVVMVQLRRIKRQNPHNNQHRSGLQDLRSIAGLTILLGLTWGFAFFAWGPVNLAFTYLFTILNSLQGFFIFVFHCALKETVRRQWRTYLCCGKLRLAENSEWSRTATQNNTKKTSLATAKSSHGSQTQSTSRSSSLSTNSIPQSNFINSSTEDGVSTSMDDSSGDVVLNEINSQHRPLHRTD